MFLSRAAGDRLTSTLPPALRFRWMRPGARSRAQLRTAVTDTSMLLPVLRNNFITVMDALVFLEMLANPSIKPFSSPVLRAAASPPAFHPLPSTSQSLAAATRGSLGTWGRFVSTGAHVALGNGGSAHRIPARRAGSKSGRNTSRLAQGRLVATDGCKHSGTFAGPNPAGERGCCPGWGQDPGPGARWVPLGLHASRCALHHRAVPGHGSHGASPLWQAAVTQHMPPPRLGGPARMLLPAPGISMLSSKVQQSALCRGRGGEAPRRRTVAVRPQPL
ncbi:uncharacterized protein LOC141748877 isoform X1 [Larus michahellis]|uniref:uncharacterized protein LOC141748877 isoform X1 n=1 Tax=Larus michahellis TaxID=119627 RepID=UPI003D9B2E81